MKTGGNAEEGSLSLSQPARPAAKSQLPPSRGRPDVEYSRMRKRRRCFSNGRRSRAAHGRSSVIPPSSWSIAYCAGGADPF